MSNVDNLEGVSTFAVLLDFSSELRKLDEKYCSSTDFTIVLHLFLFSTSSGKKDIMNYGLLYHDAFAGNFMKTEKNKKSHQILCAESRSRRFRCVDQLTRNGERTLVKVSVERKSRKVKESPPEGEI